MQTAILGASGLVGRTMLGLLERQDWIDQPPLLLTSSRSAGTRRSFRGEELVCREVTESAFEGVGVALFSAGGGASRTWAPVATERGAWVVDNSSAWRRDPQVALVVPEVNGDRVPALVAGKGEGGIIANPNCSTIQIALPCAALDGEFGLRAAHVTTLQAVSGAGQQGRDELSEQAVLLAEGEQPDTARTGGLFPRRVAANAVPEIGPLGDDGYFEEERKVHIELRKILDRDDLAVSCTATRVPVWNGHAAAVRAVLERPAPLDEVRAALDGFPGLICDGDAGAYTTPAEVSGRTTIHVGRVRHEPDRADVVLFWVVADNLLKGAAWNAVQIAARLAGAEAR